MKKSRRSKEGVLKGASAVTITSLIMLFSLILLYNAFFSFSYSHDTNYRNVSVDTRVNITEAKPEILSVNVEDPITLNAGSTVVVWCNSTIRDWNGYDTITNVTGVLYDANNASYGDSDDNNNHYTNLSCSQISNDGNYTANFTCNYTIYYYSNPGSNWTCNVTVTDNYPFNASVNGSTDYLSNTTTINQLLALNVTPLIDYGNMAVGDTSSPVEANVTNFGNSNINISVKGYGATENDGLAFVCAIGNITVENEKYDLNQSALFTDYVNLSGTFTQIVNITLPQQTNDSQQVINNTYWRLYVPPNPFGQCNGTVVFQAETA